MILDLTLVAQNNLPVIKKLLMVVRVVVVVVVIVVLFYCQIVLHNHCVGLPVYCARISTTEYARQSVDDTETAIVELTNSVLDNTKLTLREKRRYLRQLARHHRDIYGRHFSDMV